MKETRLLDKFYHIFTDNFYTTLSAAEAITAHDIFLTGTVNKNTKDLAKNVVNANLGVTESMYYRKGPVLLVGPIYKQKETRLPSDNWLPC